MMQLDLDYSEIANMQINYDHSTTDSAINQMLDAMDSEIVEKSDAENISLETPDNKTKKKEEKKQDKREDTIKDSLTNPCTKALLAQAPNLNNDIAKILRETFGTNDKYNITVTEKPLSGMSGYSSFPEVRQNSIKAIIYLNSNMLGTATQEYALATIYHEVIHVFLNAEHAKLGETVFNQKYPSVTYQDYPVGNGQQTRRYKLRTDHSRFDTFLEKLAQSIISFNPNFTLERARAIAKEGIVEDFFISPTDATFIQEQKNGTNGTKCP